MSQMNPKEFVHNAAYSVQIPYIAGHSLQSHRISSNSHFFIKIHDCKIKYSSWTRNNLSLSIFFLVSAFDDVCVDAVFSRANLA